MKWLVAKYIPDLRRREPRNIGVVLFPSERHGVNDLKPIMRFRGLSREGKLDLRRAKVVGNQSAVYEGWIDYWSSLVDSDAPASLWEARSNTDAFYLERGGELLSSLPDGATPEDLADELYEILVEAAPEPRIAALRPDEGFKAVVNELLQRSGLWNDLHFNLGYRVDLSGLREQEFHYAWVNGHTTIGHRLTSWRSDTVDATALRLALLPKGFSSVVIVPEYPSDSERALPLERVSHVAAVDDLSPSDLREMFTGRAPAVSDDEVEDPISRFEALAGK
jgi:hypothetical protein